MFIRCLLSTIFLVAITTSTCAKSVRFATFNVYWLYDDNPPYMNWSKRRSTSYGQSLDTIAAAIKRINADVIALQEIENEEVLIDLRAKLSAMGLNYKYAWASETLEPVTGQNVGVLSKYPAVIRPVRRYPGLLSDYVTEAGYSRIAAIPKLLRVDLSVGGNIVTVFAAHLKSKRGAPTSNYERFSQAKMLRRLVRVRLEKGSKQSPSFVMVMGDLNDGYRSRTLGVLRGNTDGSYALNQTSDKLAKDQRWTHIYKGRKDQLDHILPNKFLFDRLTKVEIVRFKDDVSDHDAVAVEFNFD